MHQDMRWWTNIQITSMHQTVTQVWRGKMSRCTDTIKTMWNHRVPDQRRMECVLCIQRLYQDLWWRNRYKPSLLQPPCSQVQRTSLFWSSIQDQSMQHPALSCRRRILPMVGMDTVQLLLWWWNSDPKPQVHTSQIRW